MVCGLSAEYQFLMASLRMDGKVWYKMVSGVPWSSIIIWKTSRWSIESMVDRIITLKLWGLEVRQDWFLHNLLRKREVNANIIIMERESMMKLFNLLAHFLEPLI